MDIICPVRPGDDNEELRYAVRSWETNLTFDRIWIVGHKPNWLTDVHYIPGNDAEYHANVYRNIRLACAHPDVADDILVMNDDFFITETVQPETLYRSTLTEHLQLRRVQRGGWWKRSLETTQVCLQAHNIPDPISYELHVPFPCNKTLMAETLHRFQHVTPDNPPQWRTLYGNLHNLGGKQHADVKAYSAGQLHKPYHSTEDRSFAGFAGQLARLFPSPSRYELEMDSEAA